MDIDKTIKGRTSVKRFSSKKPDWRNIIEAIDAARYAPMAGNNHTIRFILVSEEGKINEISEACQQPFIKKAQYVIAACSLPGRLINAYGNNGKIYSRQQAGAAIENFLLKLESLGLSTTWVGYFVEEQIKRALGIPKEANVEAVFPIGYDAEKKRTRRLKIDLDRILYFNEYGQTQMKPEKKLDV